MTRPVADRVWETMQARITLFSEGIENEPWLPALFEAIAENKADKVESQPKTGVTISRGKWREGELRVKSGPGRFDLILAPEMVQTVQPFPVIGSIDEMDVMIEKVETYVAPNLNSTERVALGIGVISRCENEDEATKVVTELAGVTTDLTNASDFIFQINRYRQVDGRRVNRILKCLSFSVQDIVANVAADEAQITLAANYARCDFDFNTHPSGTAMPADPIPAKEVAPWLRRLSGMVRQTLTEGFAS